MYKVFKTLPQSNCGGKRRAFVHNSLFEYLEREYNKECAKLYHNIAQTVTLKILMYALHVFAMYMIDSDVE